MKERLLIILAVVALLIPALQPALPAIPRDTTAAILVIDGECHGGGQCSL